MSRWEKTSNRPSEYSRWHRQFTGEWRYVDIDAIEYCRHGYRALAVFEITRNGTGKPFIMTRQVAESLNVPGYVVETTPHAEKIISHFRVMRVYPDITGFKDVTPSQFRKWLDKLHRDCINNCTGEACHGCDYTETFKAKP